MRLRTRLLLGLVFTVVPLVAVVFMYIGLFDQNGLIQRYLPATAIISMLFGLYNLMSPLLSMPNSSTLDQSRTGIISWWRKPMLGAAKSSKLAEDAIKANRTELLNAVDQIWLSGLLNHLLNQQASLKIDLMPLEPAKLAKRMGGQPHPLTDNQAVLKAFDDFGRRLVLLGEPGAGKTVLLLQLAKLLLDAAKQDELKRIPLIFPLASWAAKQLPFEEWLQAELRDRYGAKNLAPILVESERVIYLLDGLDEVAEEDREDCLKALKAFVEDPNRHVEYLLCSRRKEFEALQTRLEVYGEIVLQPLTMVQIRDYLMPEPFAALRGLLDTNDIIRTQFANIPFMLNTMAFVTRGKSTEELRLLLSGKDNMESLRAIFLEAYVTQRLAEHPDARYPNPKTRHWLRWLAEQLIKHDETDFYMENMQQDWLGDVSRKLSWSWMEVLIGLLIGLASMLVVRLVLGPLLEPFIGLFIALFVGLLCGVFTGVWLEEIMTSREYINMSDQLSWSFTREDWLFTLVNGLKLGLLITLIIGLPTVLVFGLGLGLAFALLIGLGLGLFIALFILLAIGTRSQSILRYRIKPGEGIQRSLKNGVASTLVFGLMFGLGLGLFVGLVFGQSLGLIAGLKVGLLIGLVFGLFIGLISGLDYGLKAFIQHYVLRWRLGMEGHLPFRRYHHFLDYAHELVILRKVGGGYRFVHDMLRQHLAGTHIRS